MQITKKQEEEEYLIILDFVFWYKAYYPNGCSTLVTELQKEGLPKEKNH